MLPEPMIAVLILGISIPPGVPQSTLAKLTPPAQERRIGNGHRRSWCSVGE